MKKKKKKLVAKTNSRANSHSIILWLTVPSSSMQNAPFPCLPVQPTHSSNKYEFVAMSVSFFWAFSTQIWKFYSTSPASI